MTRSERGRPPREEEVVPHGRLRRPVRKARRRRLIERLNKKEELIGPQSPARGDQMSEEELTAEIEKQRTLNAARGHFLF